MRQYRICRRELMRTAAGTALAFWLPSQARGESNASTRPGDDFYLSVNAAELDSMTIPPDRWDYGQFDVVGSRVRNQLGAVVKAAAARTTPRSPEEGRVAAVYRALLDETAMERSSLALLKRDLTAILHASSREALAVRMAHPFSSSIVAFNIFPVQGEWMPFLDTQNHTQPSLGLPAWNYTGEDQGSAAARDRYSRFVAELFDLAGLGESRRRAAEVVAIETAIAKELWSPEKVRDRRANLHVMTVGELESFAPGLPWRAMLAARGLGDIHRLNLGTDSAVAALARLFADTPLETWRSWLAFSWIRNGIEALPSAFRAAHRRFGAGDKDIEPVSREAEAIQLVSRCMPMDLGQLYAEAHVQPGLREQAALLVRYLKTAMVERLNGAAWLDAASRTEALAKLDAMRLKAVAPQSLPAWQGSPLRSDEPLGDLQRLAYRDWSVQLSRLTSPEARSELWYQSPQIVDASYSVLLNAIEVPAAILQPPFFSVRDDPAANFGAIGAIIGHEMGHGFDDQGVLFDSKGVLREWMSPHSRVEFARRAARLIAQYEAFEPLPGLQLNGRRTRGENIADLSGVSLALRAYQLYRADHPNRTVDERSALRAFFSGWARIWCYKGPESAIRHIVAHSYYVPPQYRVNAVVRNLDAWYDAYDVRPGDRLFLQPQDRIRLW
jgi:putative endopeptidase